MRTASEVVEPRRQQQLQQQIQRRTAVLMRLTPAFKQTSSSRAESPDFAQSLAGNQPPEHRVFGGESRAQARLRGWSGSAILWATL